MQAAFQAAIIPQEDPMNHQTIMQNAEARRSVYALDRNLPLPPEEKSPPSSATR